MTEKSYTNWHAMSDQALMEQIGAYMKHHRLQQNKTQTEVADEAGISRSTLSLLERGETVTLSTLIRVVRVLDLLHLMDAFNVETPVSPILLAKLEQEKRQRARSRKENPETGSEW